MSLDELAKKYGGSTVQSGSSKLDELAQKYGGSFAGEVAAPQRKSTVGSELVRGGKQVISSARTGIEALLGSPEEAALAGIERGRSISEEAGEGVSLETLKRAYEERGLLSAAGEAAGQIPRALAGQGANLAAMAGGARLGAMAGTAVAPGIGTFVGGALGAGATMLPQFFGSNIERQASEQIEKGEPVKIDRTSAGAAAAGQAAIESAGTAFVLGKRIVKGVLGVADDAALVTAKAQQAMTQAAERSLAAAAGRGVAKGVATEIPVEIAQSVIERAQAGLDVTSPEALSEYGEVAYQSGLIGGTLGGGAGPINTAMARQGVKAKQEFDAAEAQRAEQLAQKAKLAEEEANKPYVPGPSLTGTDLAAQLVQRPGGGGLSDILAARRIEQEDALIEEARRARVAPESQDAGRSALTADRSNADLMAIMADRRAAQAEAEQKEAQRLARAEAQQAQKQAALLGEVESPMMIAMRERRAAQEAADAAAAKLKEEEAKKAEAEKYAVSPSITKTPMSGLLGGAPAGGDLSNIISERRAAEEAKAEIPLNDDYAFLQREKQRLLSEEKTPQSKLMLERIDERMGEILKRDIENMRKDKEKTATSVFGEKNLPPVESRDVVVGGEALANLQARPATPETPLTKKDVTRLEKMREQPAPPESEADAEIAQLEKERARIKSTNLYGELMGKLAPGEVSDISPDIGKNLRVKGGRGGAFISDMVSSGLLDNYLPPDKRPGSITFDEAESTEYIKDKLRNRDTLTFDASISARDLENKISEKRREAEAPRMAEYEISEVEPGEAASIERSATEQEVGEATDIRYQRSTSAGPSIGVDRTSEVVDAIKSKWANAPKVVIAENMDDPVVPKEVREHNKAAIKAGAKGTPKGFFYNGKAYILADAMSSDKDVIETLFHESLGHYGLRGTFGPKMGEVLADVVKNRRAEVEAKAKQYGLDVNSQKDMLEAAEEVLAVMAQTKPGLPFVKRAIAIIRNFLRDLGLNIKMSDADIIQKYILPSRAFVESGKARAAEGKPAAAREEGAKTGPITEAFKRWFGDSKAVDADGNPMVMYHSTFSDVASPKTNFRGDEYRRFGFHVGSLEAAESRLDVKSAEDRANKERSGDAGANVMPVYISVKNPLRLDENRSGRWGVDDIMDAIMKKAERGEIDGISNDAIDAYFDDNFLIEQEVGLDAEIGSDNEPRAWQDQTDWAPGERSDLLKVFLQQLGYDSIVYANEFEGGGDSYIVLDPRQVKSATGNIGTYDAKKADIRYDRKPSEGKKAPITEAFKRWFGNSKVVDENGEPLVVYHGSLNKGVTEFDTARVTTRTPKGDVAGTYFTADQRAASGYTRPPGATIKSPRGDIVPAYLKIENPLNTTAAIKKYRKQGMSFGDAKRKALEALTPENDGIIFNGDGANPSEYVVFKPSQIKSATENIGTYDAGNADIRYSRDSITGKPILSQWTTPTDTKLAGDIGKDDLIYTLQDKMIDTKRVVDAISSTAGKIMAKWNPYLQEELYHGRTAKQTKDFLIDELRPLMQAMEKDGVSIADMEEYLKNRHAIAYNAQVAKVNPKMPDGGSGIKTADAQAYLNSLSPADKAKYDALAKRVDSITKGTRKILVDSGLETQETIDNWEATFPFYVPLKRGDIDYAYTAGGMGTGQGFDVRGDFSRRAMGSEREATDVLANVAMMRERAIVKAQKNRVAQALFGLAAQNPNPEFWLPVDPLAEVDPANLQELLNFGLTQQDLDFIAKEPRQKAIDKNRNEVVERINATLRNNENVISMRFNGQNRYVFFNPNNKRSKRMVESLKNLDAEQLGNVLGPISKLTRWMAAVNTQYNPVFGAYNFLRDVQGAALQLSNTPLAKERKAVVGGTLPALKGIYAAMRAERDGKKVTGQWSDLWVDFQEQGGQTGFRDQFSRSQERAEALQKELNMIKEGKLKSAGRAAINWLSDYNDSMENAVRLSAYKAALDKGIGKEEAASIAKNLTVNFNRKGQIAVQAGALYAFFNAAMQGTTRLIQTLRGPAGKKIIAGGLLLGTMQAALLAAAGFDDEEPPEFIRERNLILPIGGDKYLAFPMPLGYHVIPSTSRILTEWAMSGFKDTPDRIASLTGMYLEAFNPIGNAGWSAQTLAPTFADPIVALTENRDWTGKPIARKDFSNLDPTPGYTRAKDTASEFSTQIAKFLNYASGGTEFKPGVLSPTPDQLDYLIGQATGGVGRELLKAEQTVVKTATGEDLPSYKIPLVGRFYGETKGSAAESNRFYRNMTELNEHENEIKGRRASKQPITDYMLENPEARLAPLARKTYSEIQKLRKRKEQLLERNAPKESIKQVEEMITKRMQNFNDRVEAIKD